MPRATSRKPRNFVDPITLRPHTTTPVLRNASGAAAANDTPRRTGAVAGRAMPRAIAQDVDFRYREPMLLVHDERVRTFRLVAQLVRRGLRALRPILDAREPA
jgi:hypothetical protein